MVDVAQLVEHRIVIPDVAGSTPVIHPKKASLLEAFFLPFFIGPCSNACSIFQTDRVRGKNESK